MGILLFLVFVLVIGWLLAAALSKQKPPNRRKTIGYPTQSAAVQITVGGDDDEDSEQDDFDEEDDEYVRPLPGENSLGLRTLDKRWVSEEARAEFHAHVIRPPEEWRLERNHEGLMEVDGDWKFILDAKSEEEWQLYVYSIKNYPDLLKIGIAKDAVKRKESYYKKKLYLIKIPKREAIMVEHLFKHATYHHANNNPPRQNVGNIDEENLIDEITEFSQDNYEGSGLSEVRKITLEQAKNTIHAIHLTIQELFLDEAIEQWGIKTFDLQQVPEGRGSIEIPHLRWRLSPLRWQTPPTEGEYQDHLDIENKFGHEMAEILREQNRRRHAEDVAKYEKAKKECWKINETGNTPTTANSSDDDYQQWLTKAVKYKKDNDFDQAIECLDKAYRICAGYPLETVFDHYLRLPAYLQAAGRTDEGWGELNKLNIGVCPYRGDGPTGSERDIRKAYKVSDKMRAFLDKEKRYKESLIHRVVAAYLSAANVAQMVSDGWVKKEREKEFSVDTLTIEFDKAVKKAKLEEPLGAKLAAYVNALVKEGSKDLYVLSRIPEVMAKARSIAGES